MLVKYLRDKNNVPHGCVVSTSPYKFGYSLCAKGDVFDKKTALELAVMRANCIPENRILAHTPESLQDLMLDMIYRASRYYKV